MTRSSSATVFRFHRDRRTGAARRRIHPTTSRITEVTFCVRGVISPLLSNIYLPVLDRVWEDRCAHLGTLVRYADDFVVLCDTKAQVEAARDRVRTVLTRLGLELHPEKTRTVDLSRGHEGFDFLGCHLRKRMSGPIWEQARRRVYYLHRWPSSRTMVRVRARVRALTPRCRCHENLRRVIAEVNPVLRGWAQYFRTGHAAVKLLQIDRYVEDRLQALRRARAGSRGRRRPDDRRAFFEALGLIRLRGTIQYPGWRMPRPEDHLVSRVREIRAHGLNGGLAN